MTSRPRPAGVYITWRQLICYPALANFLSANVEHCFHQANATCVLATVIHIYHTFGDGLLSWPGH